MCSTESTVWNARLDVYYLVFAFKVMVHNNKEISTVNKRSLEDWTNNKLILINWWWHIVHEEGAEVGSSCSNGPES